MSDIKIRIGIGEWKTRDGRRATVGYVRNDAAQDGSKFVFIGHVHGETSAESWQENGHVGFGTTCAQRDLVSPWTSPIATGHNPDKLTVEQVGVNNGWRLLDKDEIHANRATRSVESWNQAHSGWIDKSWGASKDITYRTRLTRDELLALITPKKRIIRVEELPAVCWVGDEKESWMVNQRCCKSQKIWSGQGSAWGIPEIHALDRKWSSDLLTWNSFEVEDKQ